MSKLSLINEIQTTVKMSSSEFDPIKLAHYLDDLLSNYEISEKEDSNVDTDNGAYIKMYVDSRKIENYSSLTLRNYTYELCKFSTFINKSFFKVNTSDIRQYLASQQHLMQSTITGKMEKLSAFYGWLVSEEVLLKNPVSKIKRPKLPKKVREGLSIVELEKVRSACVKFPRRNNKSNKAIEIDIRKRALVEIMYSTACRVSELCALNIEDVDWNTSSIIVCGKGDKERRVYLSEKARFYLEKYLETRDDDCPALFATEHKPARRLTKSGVRHQVEQIKIKAGIDRPLHPHIFRHTFAQQSLNAGIPMEDLQSYLGHESPSTTMRYAQVSEERKRTSFYRYHQQ